MLDAKSESIPLACVPGAIPAAERPAHFEVIQSLFGQPVLERNPLASGYAFGLQHSTC